MDAIELLENRRSVRKYTDRRVTRELMTEIIRISQYAPSWSNYQIARYNIIDDKALIADIADNCVKGFVYNTKTLNRANGIVVLSYVTGESGSLKGKVEETGDGGDTNGTELWESFDAGLACMQFCLAAYAKGVSTCILGIINNETIAGKIGLPANEKVAAIIVYGYEEGEHHKAPARKPVDEVLRFIGRDDTTSI